MPWGDGTGPWWAQGRGWRCRRVYGPYPGWEYWQRFPVEPTPLTKKEEKEMLENEKKDLESSLKVIQDRLKELK